jgi:hypothetical protein
MVSISLRRWLTRASLAVLGALQIACVPGLCRASDESEVATPGVVEKPADELAQYEERLAGLEPRVVQLPYTPRSDVIRRATESTRIWIADAKRLDATERDRNQQFQFWFLRRLISGTLVAVENHLDEK